MSNPLLNDGSMRKAAHQGWGAPDPSTRAGDPNAPFGAGPLGVGRLDDGPISPWRPGVMTVGGTASATGVLLVLLLASAAIGWWRSPAYGNGEVGLPMMAIAGVIVGFIAVLVASFKPQFAKVLGPVYAIAQGFFVGAISKAYDAAYDGIVVQAIGATLGVFAVMLVLYRTQIIKVTDKFRRVVIGATIGLMLFYMVSWVVHLFGGSVSFITSASALGIGISVFAAVLAAMNLALDFDFIDRGSKEGLPKGMEWFAALGLLVTLVWLYLEFLRLLSKLNQR